MHNILLRYGEHMNTKTAREMAKPFTAAIREFIDKTVTNWDLQEQEKQGH